MSIGFTEVLLILVVILLLFGAKRIPEIAKAIGRAAFEYKKAKETIKKESEELMKTVEDNAEASSKLESSIKQEETEKRENE
ncbi:MAG: twin-arginine translocase TatA/TatE family subunit [Elusimicrobiota bacterium]|jgi:sec-independent protein translocase protein TatA|nr:twin-arginine translocase TatA/TatE family subunit [Elusimicrobiota bacterium]